MFRSDRSRAHAAPTARARRLRAAAERDAALRAKGIDPAEYERVRGSSSPWGGSPRGRDATQPVPSVPAALPQPARTRVPLRRVLLTGVVLVLAVVVIGSVLLWQRVNAFNGAVSSAPTLSSALFFPLGGSERVNVLLIGYSGDPRHGGTYLADSLNILSIDPKSSTTTLIPIPRDLWIQGVAGLGRGAKVNEAFADGWKADGWRNAGDLQASVLSQVTGLRIDHWISIDFAGFSAMVDAVGGVTVDNPRAFKYTWSETNFHNAFWNGGSFAKGTLRLNGTQALDYARTRYTSVTVESSDFARSVRQQRVLGALREKLGSGGLGSLGPGLALMDALKTHLKTDLSAFDLFLLSGHMQADRRLELKEDVVLAAGRNAAGSYILFPVGASRLGDYAPLRAYIARELAKPIPSPTPSPTAKPAA